MGEKRTAYRLLVGILEGKRPLGKSRQGWWTVLVWLRIGTSGELL
jgi:hypothetical protein